MSNMKVAIYAAVAENGIIGRDGGLPWKLSTDLKRFKADTMGKPIIMGRKTWESFPKRRPLPGRLNIVVTRNPDFAAEGAKVAKNLADALEIAKASGAEEAAVIGGATMFGEALPIADRLHITHVLAEIEGDTWFPPIPDDQFHIAMSEDFPDGEDDTYPTIYAVYERNGE